MNRVIEQDLNSIANDKDIDWTQLKNKTVLITGATGLIGSIMVKAINLRNIRYNDNIKMVLLVRNKENAQKSFLGIGNTIYIENSVENADLSQVKTNIDFIIHAASPTKSKFFVENPVETLNTAVLGTKKILDIARNKKVQSMVYLSSMEMYGTLDDKKVTEDKLGYINPLDVRSSYSEGKRMCELYSYSYCSEYGVPVKIARLAQTFGAGINKNENRVFKYFLDCIINNEDIVLKSHGSTISNFVYTTDAIKGILAVLLNGRDGEAYNIVSDNLNMTILDTAEWLAEKYGKGNTNVRIEIPEGQSAFAPDNRMILANDKIKVLGWKPEYDLKDGYSRLYDYLIEEKKRSSECRIDEEKY